MPKPAPGNPRVPAPADFVSGRGQGNIVDMTPADIAEIQRVLKNLGFYNGPVNGVADLNTLGAVGAFSVGFGFGDQNQLGYRWDDNFWYAALATNHYIENDIPAPDNIVATMTDSRSHFNNTAIRIPTSQAQANLGAAPAPPPVDTTVPPTQPVDTTTTNPVDTGEVARRSARAVVEEELNRWGLGSLRTNIDEWLTDPVFVQNPDALVSVIRQTPEYQQRFQGMAQRAQSGLNAISEAEYLELERGYQQVMRQFGLPANFYDQPDDFAGFIGRDLSVAEVAQRAQDGFSRVQQASPEVRAAFTTLFGVEGDANLAAFFLDPDRATPLLERQVEQAFVQGAATEQGFDLDRSISEMLVSRGVREQQAREGFFELGQVRRLFDESISESTDLDVEREGVGAVFGTDAGAAVAVRRRLQEREAAFEGGGGTLISSEGVTGLGSAR